MALRYFARQSDLLKHDPHRCQLEESVEGRGRDGLAVEVVAAQQPGEHILQDLGGVAAQGEQEVVRLDGHRDVERLLGKSRVQRGAIGRPRDGFF